MMPRLMDELHWLPMCQLLAEKSQDCIDPVLLSAWFSTDLLESVLHTGCVTHRAAGITFGNMRLSVNTADKSFRSSGPTTLNSLPVDIHDPNLTLGELFRAAYFSGCPTDLCALYIVEGHIQILVIYYFPLG